MDISLSFTKAMEPVIQRITCAFPGLIALYCFGSQIQGTAHATSDVDLAILPNDPLAPERMFELKHDLAIFLHREVDLIDLRVASTVLRMQVLSNGECLFSGNDRIREEFETVVFASYARLNEERCGILDDIRARGTIYA